MRRAGTILVAALGGLLAAAVIARAPATAPRTASATTKAPLVIIWMENHERSDIINNATAPYMNQLANTYRDFTHYDAVSHPSLPNYLSQGNGSTDGKVGTDTVTAGEVSGTTVWNQLTTAGIGWKVYMESMPSACSSAVTSGEYALKHNPATPFHDVFTDTALCQAHVLPWTSSAPLAPITFISPNLCNDMHDCSVATGNGWLANVVPGYLAQGAKVLITFDEGSTSTGGGGNVYCVVAKTGMAHSERTGTFNHYSLLAAIEDRYGLTRLGSSVGIKRLPIG
jgi:hypothetical protein